MTPAVKTMDVEAAIRKQFADDFARAAKEAGYRIVREYLTCELGNGHTVLTAPIARDEAPNDKELTKGVDLLFAYVSKFASGKLAPGYYTIKLATSGYDFEEGVKVSFVNAKGATVHSFPARAKRLGKGKFGAMPGLDESGTRTVWNGRVCGRKKCFAWKRIGFLEWELGCVDKETEAVVNCV